MPVIISESYTLKSSNSTVAEGVFFFRGYNFLSLVAVVIVCGRYGQKVTLNPFRTAVPFRGQIAQNFEWFVPETGLHS